MKGEWLKEVYEPHECPKPHRGRNWTGSIWQCNECGQAWELTVPDETYAGRGNDQWAPVEVKT